MRGLLSFIAFFAGLAGAVAAVKPEETAIALGLAGEEAGAINLVLLGITAGAIGSIVIASMADRIGRRPVLAAACIAGGALSALTAASTSLAMFAAFQFAARTFTVAALVLVVIVAVEESPTNVRGRTIGRLTFFGALGVAAATLGGQAVETLGGDWRILHLSGSLLLLAGIAVPGRIKEPNLWVSRPAKTQGVAIQLFQTGSLFFFTYAAALSALGWWRIYAAEQRGIADQRGGALMAIGYGLGLAGYLIAGRLQDNLGRRRTGSLFLFLACLSTIGVFQVGNEQLMVPLMVLAAFFGTGSLAVITTLGAEIFPTGARATSLAVSRGLFATLGGIGGPLLAGALTDPNSGFGLAIGDSVSVTALMYIPAIMLLLTLPETNTRELRQIEAAAEIPEPDEEYAYEPVVVPARVTHPSPTVPEPLAREPVVPEPALPEPLVPETKPEPQPLAYEPEPEKVVPESDYFDWQPEPGPANSEETRSEEERDHPSEPTAN
ncbi:MAG: MFS transporter [Actinobacteria bacterium]|nr:MFS transporter [Actinomycetota bacterium]